MHPFTDNDDVENSQWDGISNTIIIWTPALNFNDNFIAPSFYENKNDFLMIILTEAVPGEA